MRAIVAIAAALLLVAGCEDVRRDESCVVIVGKVPFCLAPTTSVPSLRTVQRLDVSSAALTEQFVSVMEVDSQEMRIVLLSPLGQRLATITFDNDRIASDLSPGVDRRLDVAQVAAFAQLAWWPIAALQQAQRDGRASLTEDRQLQLRRLSDELGGTIEVRLGPARSAVIQISDDAMRVVVQTLEWEEMP